jgi:hypothetical protein
MRQIDFLALLEAFGLAIPTSVTTIDPPAGNVSLPDGDFVQVRLTIRPRFVFPFSPVQCS